MCACGLYSGADNDHGSVLRQKRAIRVMKGIPQGTAADHDIHTM